MPVSRRPTRGLRVQRADTFETHGVVGRFDHRGVERFNFPQAVWLYAGIPMGSIDTFQRTVLAVNILTRLVTRQDLPVLIGTTSRRAMQLAPEFVRDCLEGRDFRGAGYAIPIEALREWMDGRR